MCHLLFFLSIQWNSMGAIYINSFSTYKLH